MKDRVIGIENEYAFVRIDGADASHCRNTRDVFSSARGHGVFTMHGSRWWLRNGGCAYLDQDKLEQASPECRRIRDVVAYNKAAERHMQLLTQGQNGEQLYDLYKTTVAPTRKSTSDPYNKATHSSFGCHENYLVYGLPDQQYSYNEKTYRRLLPFLVTRQLYGGAGWWKDPKEDVFWRSQRAYFTEGVSSNMAVTGSRAILNQHSDPHTPIKGYNRYHIVMGDANMLEYALYLKIGATSLVLGMLEKGKLPLFVLNTSKKGDKYDHGPTSVFHDVAQQSDLNEKTIYMRNKGEYNWQNVSPLELQTGICEKAHAFVKRSKFDSEESKHEAETIISMWDETLAALHRKDDTFLYGRIDWRTKQLLADDEIKKRGVHFAEEIRDDLDVLYHEMRSGSLYEELVQSGIAVRLVTDQEIERALHAGPLPTPTQGTRATVRARVVSDAIDKLAVADTFLMKPNIDWEHICYLSYGVEKVPGMREVHASPNFLVPLDDPLEYTSEIYDRFVKANLRK